MSKLALSFVVLLAAFMAGCSSLVVDPYAPTDVTRESLERSSHSYRVGGVSGQTRVESDQLVKSSLPCRMQSVQMPESQPVNLYIENALHAELQAAGKLAGPEGRKIDVVVVKLESDTSKIRNGRWTLDFQYKIGKTTREVVTTTEYGFAKDTTEACRNTADALDDALRANFAKFFKTLN
jgi:hypothetical protein